MTSTTLKFLKIFKVLFYFFHEKVLKLLPRLPLQLFVWQRFFYRIYNFKRRCYPVHHGDRLVLLNFDIYYSVWSISTRFIYIKKVQNQWNLQGIILYGPFLAFALFKSDINGYLHPIHYINLIKEKYTFLAMNS